MMKKQTVQLCLGVLALAYLFTFSACSTTRVVKPLKAKELMISADFGGPLIAFGGGTIPIPFTSIMGAYGIDSNLTVYGGLHPTAAAYGTLQMDLGAVYKLYQSPKQYLPCISTGVGTQLLLDVHEATFRAYPVVDVNFYWEYLKSRNNYVYVNWSSFFDFWGRANGQPNAKAYRTYFGLGHTFENAKMRYTVEAKYLLPWEDSGGTPVEYRGINGKGGIGVYIGISRKF